MATRQTSGYTYTDGWPGGQIKFRVIFETYINSGNATPATDVTIEISSDAGGADPVAQTSDGIVVSSAGQFDYTWNIDPEQADGTYTVTWQGVRASDGKTVQYKTTATIAAPAEPGVYASLSQYRARTLDSATSDDVATMRLRLASEQVDAVITGAVYATDANGMPLSPALADVLMKATCEQARYLNAKSDDSGLKDEYQSMSVAGISYSRGTGTTGTPRLPQICAQAKAILHTAGVLQSAPLVNW